MKRYLIAILISALGVAASYHFLRPKNWSAGRDKEEKPLARIAKVVNEVEKKSKGNLIWSPISNGTQLYQGEMVKTSKDSQAVLEFIETGSIIELEQESTVVIEQMEQNVSLDVISGGLFVKSVKKDGKSITLRSGKKKLDLGNSDLSFSVGKKGNVGVQVHKGQVQANVAGKRMQLTDRDIGTLSDKGMQKEKNRFANIRPSRGETVYLRSNKRKVTTFKWKPLDPDYKIIIEMGTSRSRLEPLKIKPVPGEIGKVVIKTRLGSFFWRLLARSEQPGKTPFSSIIYKNDFLAMIPPVPLLPAKQEIIYLAKPGRALNFSWSTPSLLASSTLEISRDRKFQKIALQYTVKNSTTHNVMDMATKGRYFWRVRGNLKDSNKSVISKVQGFELRFGQELRPPTLISPTNGKKFFLEGRSKKAVYFTWNRKKNSNRYRFVLRGLGNRAGFSLKKDKESPQIGIKKMKAGLYEWQVASIDKTNKVSEFSPKRKINIFNEMPELRWLKGVGPHNYVGTRSPINLQWSHGPQEIVSWKLMISESKRFRDKKEEELDIKNYSFQPQADGIYFAKVYGYDEERSVVAKSLLLSFKISPLPLPDPPQFSKIVKNPIKATKSGKLRLAFIPDKKISKYSVEVKDLKGNVIQQVRLKENKGFIRSLMPGQYWVSARSIDKHGRMGPPGETRQLLVPKKSNLVAPKVEKIIIK